MGIEKLQKLQAVARGDLPADLLLAGGKVINVFTGEIEQRSVAVYDGVVVGSGDYDADMVVRLRGAFVSPGVS